MRLKSVGELGRVNSLMMLRLIEAINDDDDYIDDNDDGLGELGCVVCLVLHTGSEDHAGQRLSQLCSGNITSCLRYLTIRKLLSNPTIRFCVYTVHLSPGVLGKPGILPWLGSARLAKNSVSFLSFSTSCDNKLIIRQNSFSEKLKY